MTFSKIMENAKLIAEIALRELNRRERLKEIIHRPGYRYYLQGGIVGVIFRAAAVAFLLWMLLRGSAPPWGVMVFGLAFISLLETTRQKERLNALLKLRELDETSEQNAGQVSSEAAPGASPDEPSA